MKKGKGTGYTLHEPDAGRPVYQPKDKPKGDKSKPASKPKSNKK